RDHRRPRRPRSRTRAAARRGADDRRAALHRDARARRRGPLVQGDPRARGGARLRRRLSAARAGAALRRHDALAALALGAVQTLAYVYTALWPLQLVAVGLLAWLAARRAPRHAALLGFAYGVGWLGAG